MAAFGACGKMPSLGDFFRIGLGPGFVDPWDNWLQQGMIALRTDMKDRWDACYMSAPVWRFSLASGIAGPLPVLGVLMPSVDRVGRQFPLTLCAQLPASTEPASVHFAAADLLDALESLALDALDDAMTRDALAARLSALPALPKCSPLHARRVDGALAFSARGSSADLVSALAARLSGQGVRAPGIFSAAVEDKAYILVSDGLPTPAQMHALVDLEAPAWATPEPTGEKATGVTA